MPASVNFQDVRFGFDFVSGGMPCESTAYLNVETGEIHYHSDYTDEELPEDIEDEKYIAIPHKNDLGLGARLALRFADYHLPEKAADKVHQIFRRKGAYARFKDLLDSIGMLQEWYDYEEKATNEALRNWCELNGIKIND